MLVSPAQFSSFSGMGSGQNFANPFEDLASLAMPTNMRSALYWCEYVFSLMGTYRTAMERIISYFLTEIQIDNASEDEQDKWLSFYKDVVDAISVVQSMWRNKMAYGNAFASVVIPFQRFLTCPKCGSRFILNYVYNNKNVFNFRFTMPDFVATCPTCKVGSGYRGKWNIKDEMLDAEKKFKVKVWNPHEIELLHDKWTEDVAYLWRIPEDYKLQIRQGDLFHLERCPKGVLDAISKNLLYRFNPDAMFHMKEPTLAGIINRGWGIPRILSNFRQIWYVQVLRRFNEAIALDYVIPFRVITPAPATGSTGSGAGGMAIDPMSMFSGQDFRSMAQRMIARRHKDPAALQVFPFPVNFQMFGADANKLAPRDLLDQATEMLLNDAGTPTELYNGSLQLQAAPMALRLFESLWHHLVADGDMLLSWMGRQASQIMSWEMVQASMKRATIADNLEKQMMEAQLMMSQQLSGTTFFSGIGHNWRKEQRQIADEAQYTAELQARTQEQMQQGGFAQQIAKGQDPAAGGGGGAQGAPQGAPGDPTGGQGPVTQYLATMSPNVPQTPQDMLQVASSIAQDLLGRPESVKDSELRKLLTQNKPLHDLVVKSMEETRNKTRQQAGTQAVGQMQQQGAAGGAPQPGMAA